MEATADAATYELLKSAMLKYYRDFDPTLGTTTIKEKTDAPGKAIVDIFIKVKDKNGNAW